MDDIQFGLDPGYEDVSMVVMRRTDDGHWRIESTDGPDGQAIADMVAAAMPPQAPPPPDTAPQAPTLAEQVREWMAQHAPLRWTPDARQRQLVESTFARLIASGQIWPGAKANPADTDPPAPPSCLGAAPMRLRPGRPHQASGPPGRRSRQR